MNIPNPTDPIWRDLLLGNSGFEFDSLALKILISRLTFEIKYDESEETMEKVVSILQNFFVENSSLASVKKDLSKIIHKEV